MTISKRQSQVPEPLAHFIAGEIARAIELGEYKPGERLLETEIAAHYGVSRAPVREALRMLTKDELVTQRPRRGTVVVDLSIAEINEMFELRSALYAAVVRLFVQRAAPADLKTLGSLMRNIRDLAADPSITPSRFVEATQESSAFLVANCGNGRLHDTFRKLTRQSYRYYAQMAHSTAATRQKLAEFCMEMLSVAQAGDAEKASLCAWRLHQSIHEAALEAITKNSDQESP